MSEDILKTIKGLMASGKGDSRRLREIIEVIKKGEPMVMSDYRYIQTLTESKSIEGEQGSITRPNKNNESLELLRVRLAEGQITIEQFRELKKALTEDE
ncbi:MAG TPA: hypothetical protein VFP45_00100 [Candidatus Nitrosotalea sp.]|jgi:hypothetical protein|nr:hypothetical protein [Candidatus Nitrosotalea sp.]